MSGILSTRRIFAFVQARLGSTRFPQKVLKPIHNSSPYTTLDHIVTRLQPLFSKERIIFLIPTSDLTLENFLQSRGYLYYKGDEYDVRDRFRLAAKFYQATDIFRCTGDNPFLDIESLEFLYEAVLQITDERYSLAMNHLPLGMGVEVFSTLSLNEDTIPIEPRHKEHVSLHIKEMPSKHKIYRLIPPHIAESDWELAKSLRITFDTQEDYGLLQNLAKVFTDSLFSFGAKDVLDLAKKNSNFFLPNVDVPQVTFSLPKEELQKPKVKLIYANPEKFGSGHYTRMKSLSIYLQLAGYDVRMSDTISSSLEPTPHIFDSRELYEGDNNSYYIDHLKYPESQNSIGFLPHPILTKSPYLFFSSALVEKPLETKTIPDSLLIYAGNLEEAKTENLDNYVCSLLKFPFSILRIGGCPPKFSEITYKKRVFSSEFLHLLDQSEFFITYFGQSMMEALYRKKKVLLVGISDIHDELGNYAEELFGIPYLGKIGYEKRSLSSAMSNYNSSNHIFERKAHHRILDWLKKVTHAE